MSAFGLLGFFGYLLLERRIVVIVIVKIRRRRHFSPSLFIRGSDYKNNGDCYYSQDHKDGEGTDKELEEALEETSDTLNGTYKSFLELLAVAKS